jgi:hypothetical protein
MSKAEPGCFRCNSSVDHPADIPWQWSEPRSLCASHKAALELEDGQQLKAVLGRVTPPDSPLEGSLLSRVFNPVFVTEGADQKSRAWADFAAGGMAVFEDRFFAQSYFEFLALERAGAVDLLYALRLAAAAGTTVTSVKEMITAIVAAEKTVPQNALGRLRRSFEGWRDLVQGWNFQFQLAQVRSSTRRLWPESCPELDDWIKACRLEGEEPRPGTETSLFRKLGELALRRFPVIGR